MASEKNKNKKTQDLSSIGWTLQDYGYGSSQMPAMPNGASATTYSANFTSGVSGGGTMPKTSATTGYLPPADVVTNTVNTLPNNVGYDPISTTLAGQTIKVLR